MAHVPHRNAAILQHRTRHDHRWNLAVRWMVQGDPCTIAAAARAFVMRRASTAIRPRRSFVRVGRRLRPSLRQIHRYDRVIVTRFDPSDHVTIAPLGSADLVMTFGNVHNWYVRSGSDSWVVAAFDAMFRALKPGGMLGVVDYWLPAGHRSRIRKAAATCVKTIRHRRGVTRRFRAGRDIRDQRLSQGYGRLFGWLKSTATGTWRLARAIA